MTLPNIIYCDGGLSNRLNCLLFPLVLRNKFGGLWEICWPRTNWCHAQFNSLFSINDLKISQKNLCDISDMSGYQPVIHQNFGHFNMQKIILHECCHTYEDYRNILNLGSPIIYAHSLLPTFIHIPDIAKALQELEVVTDILNIARAFTKDQGIDDKVIGLHIRKTDFGNKVNEDHLFHLARSSQKRFLICSDSIEVNQRFASLENCVLFPKTSFPEKFLVSQDWGIPLTDVQGQIIYNIQRSEQSVIEALIDLLLLSKTTIAQTSGSTFLHTALLFKATNFFK